jgi:hypothetical protein
MRCLYCGKELALLKRLRGGGDFCSDAHKHSYQEEYNRLALSRLLQAQKKGQQTTSPTAQNATPPPSASLALEEPAPPVFEETASVPADAPLVEADWKEGPPPARPESLNGAVAAAPAGESEPLNTAGFLLEDPTIASWPDETPFSEPWLELAAGPAMSEWVLQNGTAFSLSTADLLSLDLAPKASSIEDLTIPSGLSPHIFPGTPPERPQSALPASKKKIANKYRLPTSGAIAIDIAPSAVASVADQSFVQGIGFESAILVGQSQLLELLPTAIDFPAEGSDIVVLARSHFSGTMDTALALAETQPEMAVPEAPSNDYGPRSSLEALSRLHQELAEQEAARTAERSTASVAEIAEGMPLEVVAPAVIAPAEAVTDPGLPAEPQMLEIQPEEPTPAEEALKPAEETLRPNHSTELFEIAVRTFPPAKPALIAGEPFPSHIGPLLPHLKSLPLRPKVALATNYVPSSIGTSPSQPKADAAIAAVPAPSPSKPAPSGKPAARLTQPKRPSSLAGKAQPDSAKAPAPPTPASPKPAVAAQESVATPVVASAATSRTSPERKAPAADSIKPAADAAKPPAEQAKPAADQIKNDSVPSFDIAEPANSSWHGSLKVKLGIAIVFLLIACGYFLGWGGGKSHNPTGPNATGDGSGPSIILGEGGWVEDWGGDPTGLHAGRQITIYRPSLKLSDYRLQFQASIDLKSVGWVFRASDPENYYAMKLMTVSSGLSTKVALFKYLVANGKQTQVGRVPIDLAVHPDTVFDVRVDVRGPQFTTYIQGQQVDSWTDDQLKIGGAGFLNEREERGNVKSVSIRYLSGPAK